MAHAATADEHAMHSAHLDTSTGLDNRKMAFWTFIGAECLIFGGLIGSYLAYKGNSVTGPYPHPITIDGVQHPGLLSIPLTSISTAVLLFSSLFMVLGLAAVQRDDQKKSVLWLGLTALAGAVFLGFQIFEFNHFYHQGLTLGGNLFGSTFYVLTGFHGAHVAVGVLYLLTLTWMAAKGRLGPKQSVTCEIGGLYWHFVDVVWIVIFPVVYLIP